MGIQPAVGSNDAVAIEVIVTGGIAAVVATVGKDFATRNGALVAQALIDEVPDVAALILRILADELPVLLEAAHRVAHGVGIFALDERTRVVALGVTLAPVVVGIHRASDVGITAVVRRPLILTGARRVGLLHPSVGLLEVRTETGLVAE